MSFTYAVPKQKANRISYRFIGCVFFAIALLQLITVLKGIGGSHIMLTSVFLLFLGMYGAYLIYFSFRKQAFDMIYHFDENGMKITHHYGETEYSFDDISVITIVVADENQIFYVLNIKAKKSVYTIPFTGKRELAEAIYEFVNARIKHEDNESDESA